MDISAHHRETRINRAQMDDLFDMMWREIPGASIALEAFLEMALGNEIRIVIPSLNVESDEYQQAILKQYYVPWRKDCYRWLQSFGFCPYFFRTINGGETRVPVVPVYGSGYPTIHMTEDHIPSMRWYWNDSESPDQHDDSIRYIIEYMPLLNGMVTCPAASLIQDFKLVRIALDTAIRAAWQSSRQPIFLQHAPSKAANNADNLLNMTFADEEEQLVRDEETYRRLEQYAVDREALLQALDGASGVQRAATRRLPIIRTETQESFQNRHEDDWSKRAVPLDPYWTANQLAPIRVPIDPTPHQQRLDELASALVGFPLSMVVNRRSTRAADSAAQLRVMNERINSVIIQFNGYVKNAFLEANEKQFKRAIRELIRKEQIRRSRKSLPDEDLLMFNRVLDIEVQIDSTPLIGFESLKRLRDEGIVTQEEFVMHGRRMHGFPHLEVEDLVEAQADEAPLIVATDDEERPKKKEKKRKDPLDLDAPLEKRHKPVSNLPEL